MKKRFEFSRKSLGYIEYESERSFGVISPSHNGLSEAEETRAIMESFEKPIGAPRISEAARGRKDAVILIDDNTRNTPAYKIVPKIILELHEAGIRDERIKLLVATGTHRAMTQEEKGRKVGSDILSRFEIIDHLYDDPETMVSMGRTEKGTDILVNRLALDADFLIGVGHIVPHRIPGFGGGGKIVQPGVCGEITTGQTHWLSAQYDSYEIMGIRENPVRKEIDDVARMVGLDYIVNVVLDVDGRVAGCVSGDMVDAHKEGCRVSSEVFCKELTRPADIVVSEAFPSDLDLWQAVKGLFSADCAVRKSGIIILCAGLDEGVSGQHSLIEELGYPVPEDILSMVESGKVEDLTVAAHLMHISRIIHRRAKTILVSDTLSKATIEKLGFIYAPNAQRAYEQALDLSPQDARSVFLRNGGEVMPAVKEGRYML